LIEVSANLDRAAGSPRDDLAFAAYTLEDESEDDGRASFDPPSSFLFFSPVRATSVTGRSYRQGLLLVAATIALSALVVGAYLSFSSANPPQTRAAQDLGAGSYTLGSFSLVERSGKAVASKDLADQVWVASFIFTRCKASCPRITSVMKGLQDQLKPTGVKLVSISVDPEHDTPKVLAEYASLYQADPDRWLFLTGEKANIYDLILKQFRISVAESSPESQQAGAEAVAHSDRLVLVAEGNRVIGLFDSNEPAALKSLVEKARRIDGLRKPWVRALPALNATLNGTCFLLLLAGWFLIRSGRTKGHVACMISGVVVSALFLACYLVYHYHAGSKAFVGPTPARFVYYTILMSHTILATFGVVPYLIVTLYRAIRKTFDRHAKIAAVTLPIWMYVSVTGVVIYWMLYQMTFPSPVLPG
jgi:protein SCO1/2/putative membrane protein